MDLLETCGEGGGWNEGELGGVWRKLVPGYPVLAGYIQTGQGQDRMVGRGGDKDMERLRAGGGMWGLGGRGGRGA